MNAPETKKAPSEIQQKYRDNFTRHMLSVTLHLQSEIMDALTMKHGHSQLRINFEPYIAMAAKNGARLSDIAETLGISRQAANQTANQIETAAYLQRAPDPSDGRAKLLVVTPRAKALIRQGSKEAIRVQEDLSNIVGTEELSRVNLHMVNLCDALELTFFYEDTSTLVLSAIMPRLSDYITNRLQDLTAAIGHPKLKRSFGYVLTAIGPQGGRIQQIAETRDVSKQAVSAIATELEDLGYVKRAPDPADARQVVLLFTEAGQQLIADSVKAVDQLAREFTELIGAQAMQEIATVMAQIYRSLHLEQDIFGDDDNNDIRVMARQINRQLGEDGAKALARLLLTGEAQYQKEKA